MQDPWPLIPMLLALLGPAMAQPTESQAKALLGKIDSAFNAQDLEALLGQFRPTHKTLAAQLEARMRAVMGFGARLHRDSEIVKFKQRHGRGIALVRCTTRCLRNPRLQHREHCYLVAGPDLKAELMVPVNDHALAQMDSERFRCPACNYAFGGSSHWLGVPAWPDQTGCMESLTFIALGQDLVAEVSVHVLDNVLPADKALLELLEGMKELPWLDAARATKVRRWLPPAYAQGKAPKHLDGARCQVPLRDGSTADVRLATFGPVRYLMVVQGRRELLESRKALIQDLLKGFELLDTSKGPTEICRLSLQTHTGGGCIKGNTYEHPAYDLEMTAPEGWKGTAYASRHLFRVQFECQAGAGNLLLQAMAPPVGFTTWPVEKANQLFLYSCADRELEPTTDTGWQRGARDLRWREAQSRRNADDQRLRITRLAISREILVLMAGEARDQAALEAIRKAMGSLALGR